MAGRIQKCINTQIPNLSDKAYVTAVVAVCLPSKESAKRDNLIVQVREMISSIPADYDRILRLETLAEMVMEFDGATAKDCLTSAMRFSQESLAKEDSKETQKRIIDLAHKIDPQFAAGLCDLTDHDPARQRYKTEAKKRLEFLEMRHQLGNGSIETNRKWKRKPEFPDACWTLLASLNASKIVPLKLDFLAEHIQSAAYFPFNDGYPIFAWVLGNIEKKYSGTLEARTKLIPIFKGALLSAELCGRVAIKSLLLKRPSRNNPVAPHKPSTCIIVGPNERAEGLAFIKGWFIDHLKDYIKICDPYFSVEDIELLQLIKSVSSHCRVSILTSRYAQKDVPITWEESYYSHWRLRVSEQAPPDTEIMIVGDEHKGALPIHDRWWITDGGGLRVGTSFNSLGIGKTSEISELSPDEAVYRGEEIDEYLNRRKREHNSQRLIYRKLYLD